MVFPIESDNKSKLVFCFFDTLEFPLKEEFVLMRRFDDELGLKLAGKLGAK